MFEHKTSKIRIKFDTNDFRKSYINFFTLYNFLKSLKSLDDRL